MSYMILKSRFCVQLDGSVEKMGKISINYPKVY